MLLFVQNQEICAGQYMSPSPNQGISNRGTYNAFGPGGDFGKVQVRMLSFWMQTEILTLSLTCYLLRSSPLGIQYALEVYGVILDCVNRKKESTRRASFGSRRSTNAQCEALGEDEVLLEETCFHRGREWNPLRRWRRGNIRPGLFKPSCRISI